MHFNLTDVTMYIRCSFSIRSSRIHILPPAINLNHHTTIFGSILVFDELFDDSFDILGVMTGVNAYFQILLGLFFNKFHVSLLALTMNESSRF